MDSSLYDIKINDIKGQPLDLRTFKDKKLIIVNVASECGYTNQYAQLQALFETYRNTLNILACPCNDFGNQEPKDAIMIEQFCEANYGITFYITEKIKILHHPHDLYVWLNAQSSQYENSAALLWNFHKYLINADGTMYSSIPSSVEPGSEEIIGWLNSNHL